MYYSCAACRSSVKDSFQVFSFQFNIQSSFHMHFSKTQAAAAYGWRYRPFLLNYGLPCPCTVTSVILLHAYISRPQKIQCVVRHLGMANIITAAFPPKLGIIFQVIYDR